jgi:hypothetical protein
MPNDHVDPSQQVSGSNDAGIDAPIQAEGPLPNDDLATSSWIGLHYINEHR